MTEHSILLTGATGTLGPKILAELLGHTDASITCLARSRALPARERVLAALRAEGVASPPEARLRVVEADLAQPHLGLTPSELTELAHQHDIVVHNAASLGTPGAADADMLRSVNVHATKTLARLAVEGSAAFHHVGTVGVFAACRRSEPLAESALPDPPPTPGSADGYEVTKWEGELEARAVSGRIPVTIYRVGNLLRAEEAALFGAMLANVPALPDAEHEEVVVTGVFADDAGEFIARAALGGEEGTFHVVTDDVLAFADLRSLLGGAECQPRRLPLAEWIEMMDELVARVPPMAMARRLLHPQDDAPRFSTERFRSALARLGLEPAHLVPTPHRVGLSGP